MAVRVAAGYVCSVCGDISTEYEAGEQGDWLVASVPGSRRDELVIRCPQHITRYAIRKAGGRIENGKGVVNHYEYELVRK